MMEERYAFSKCFCHTIAILVVLINGLGIIVRAHANNETRDVMPTTLDNSHEMSTLPNPATSTIRPWPSDKFLRKVLSVKRNNHKNATNIRKRQRQGPSKHRTTEQDKHTKKYSWSHYHDKHDSNLASEADYKLNITHPRRKDATRLKTQSKLDNKNQSIDNLQPYQNSKLSVVNTQESTTLSFHSPKTFSVINHDTSDFNIDKNLPEKETFALPLFERQADVNHDAIFWPENPSELGNYERPAVMQQNYGIGFQYEISPYPTHSKAAPSKIVRQTPKPLKPLTTSTIPPTTVKSTRTDLSTTHSPLLNEKPEENPHKNAERSNPWKKIPTLTVTVRPLGELYPSSTPFPIRRTKTKRPQWGLSPALPTQASSTHAHYPYPFPSRPTRTTTTPPPPHITFAQFEFDTPASSSPVAFINSPTLIPQQGLGFGGDFGFPSVLPSPFSPITAAPPQQHVHIRPNFETHQHTKINPNEIFSIHSSSSGVSLNRPFTNIWYKPIINHFISTAGTETEPPTTSTHELPSGLIFKVWNYNKNGKLTLVNENVIPSAALEGFQLENGAILNFDQIPITVQDTVASAILEFNQNQDNFQPFDNIPNYGFESSLKASGSGMGDEQGVHQSNIGKPISNRKYVNYVIVEKMTNSPGLEIDDFVTKLKPTTYQEDIPVRQDVPGSNHRSTTNRPEVVDNEESPSSIDKSWQQLHDLLLSVKDIRLPTPVEQDSAPAPPPPRNSETDSFQTEETGNKQLMANMAATAILMSYLSNRANTSSHLQKDPLPATEKTDITPLQSNDPIQIYNHLIQVLKNKTDSQTNTRTTPTTPPPLEQEPQKDKSSLILKGLVKKGIKKGIKKVIKKKKKKKFKKIVSKLVKPLAHIFKKPKEYWFDVKFDVDLYDILKKKFLYYLALKYMPVALIVALKLVPLALLMIPILWKIYWVKKRPKYIRVPVPYPVYKYVKPHDHHRRYRHHQDFEGSGNHPVSIFKDSKLFSDFKSASAKFSANNPLHFPPPPPIILKTSGLGPHPIDLQNEANRLNINNHNFNNFRPHTVTHAYELGFDLGSKLGTISNTHDQEVLKILIESRKNKIKGLLKKWQLLRSGGSTSTTPIQRLGHFVTSRENQENNEIVNTKENPFVKKKRKRKK